MRCLLEPILPPLWHCKADDAHCAMLSGMHGHCAVSLYTGWGSMTKAHHVGQIHTHCMSADSACFSIVPLLCVCICSDQGRES